MDYPYQRAIVKLFFHRGLEYSENFSNLDWTNDCSNNILIFLLLSLEFIHPYKELFHPQNYKYIFHLEWLNKIGPRSTEPYDQPWKQFSPCTEPSVDLH